MAEERRPDRRNRRWGSLYESVDLRVRVSPQAKAILSALRNCEEQQISYGAVIEKLVEPHARVLEQVANEKDGLGQADTGCCDCAANSKS
jgi:hypothetical protein